MPKFVILYTPTPEEFAESNRKHREVNKGRSTAELPTCPVKGVRGPFDTEQEAEDWYFNHTPPSPYDRYVVLQTDEPGEAWGSVWGGASA